MTAPTSTIDPILSDRAVVICVGSGGVGKTTTSAALALRAAGLGRRAIVLTIDPARRLANALGMATMPNHAVTVETPGAPGRLSAMMLDTKTTFDALIERHAPTPAERDAILDNPFYRKASTSLAGAHEYMATEQLLWLHEGGEHDLIVLDTPPSTHAMDFLDAPRRLHRFLDSASARMIRRTTQGLQGPLGLFRIGGLLARGVSRFVGSDFFVDLLAFIQSFEGLYDGLRERAARARSLLRSERTGFVVVHSPEAATLREAARFEELLGADGMRVDAFCANRVHLPAAFDVARAEAALHARLVDGDALGLVDRVSRERLAAKLTALHRQLEELARRDAAALAHPGERVTVRVPHFDQDIHDLAGLTRFAATLAGAA